MKRNNSIDFVKGILILSVVLGHVLLGGVRQNILRYMIYSIHMPLFIAMSGYLLNTDKLKTMSVKELIKKYFFRVGIPWIIAVNVYFVWDNAEYLMNGKMDNMLKTYLISYVRPYLHLWYIPAFLTYVILTYIVVKLVNYYFQDKKSEYMVLGMFAGIISIIAFYNKIPSIKLYYYVFFVFGIFGKKLMEDLRDEKTKSFVISIAVTSVIVFLIRVFLFTTEYDLAKQVSLYYYVLNFPLIIAMCCICFWKKAPGCRWVEFAGRESLSIYLWHVF